MHSLAMGGYGGLYIGDDFDNAYRITYGLNYWPSLRCDGA